MIKKLKAGAAIPEPAAKEKKSKGEKIEIVVADAWVDTMPVTNTPGGILHVALQINSNNHGRHFIRKIIPQGINKEILLLEIIVAPVLVYIFNPQNLTYTQELNVSDQYKEIQISFNGKTLGKIDKIPIIK